MSTRQIITWGLANIIYFIKRKEFRGSRQKILVFTGTSGKTTTRDAVAFALQKVGFPVLSKPLGYTNEIGSLLTALNISSFRFLSPASWKELFKKKIEDESFVCVELGADCYKDIPWFIKHFTPFAVFITGMSDESWSRDIDVIIQERESLFSKIPSEGYIIYNKDEAVIANLVDETKTLAHRIAVSVNNDNVDVYLKFPKDSFSEAISVMTKGKDVPIRISQPIFLPQAYAIACAVGFLQTLGCVSFDNIFADYLFSKDRLQIYKTSGGAMIVEDSYKATPFCMTWFLKMAASVKADEKIIVVVTEMRPLSLSINKYYTQLGIDTRFAHQIYYVGPKKYFNILHKANLKTVRISEQDYSRIAQDITTNHSSRTIIFLKGSFRYHLDRLRKNILEIENGL